MQTDASARLHRQPRLCARIVDGLGVGNHADVGADVARESIEKLDAGIGRLQSFRDHPARLALVAGGAETHHGATQRESRFAAVTGQRCFGDPVDLGEVALGPVCDVRMALVQPARECGR